MINEYIYVRIYKELSRYIVNSFIQSVLEEQQRFTTKKQKSKHDKDLIRDLNTKSHGFQNSKQYVVKITYGNLRKSLSI